MPKMIMVVDDEPQVLEEMESWLEESGYEVIASPTVEEGFQRLKDRLPSLILLDIIMPKPDGIEALSKLKRNPETASIPVIMVTAKKDTNTILEAQEMNIADFVTKPFKTDELLDSIRRFIS